MASHIMQCTRVTMVTLHSLSRNNFQSILLQGLSKSVKMSLSIPDLVQGIYQEIAPMTALLEHRASAHISVAMKLPQKEEYLPFL